MHEGFMREAIRLARESVEQRRGGPFGAVVARDGAIVSRGWNQVTASHDPTAHAEIVALREACRILATFRLDGCDVYTSCEPCPMCLAAVYWARVSRVFFAATRHDAALAGFDDEALYREIVLPIAERSLPITQMLRDEAVEAFAEWRAMPGKVDY